MATLYRAGIIATGAIAESHTRGYYGTKGIELVACADIDKPRAEAFAAKWSIQKVYADYREMLDHEHLDIVSICSWHHQHAEMVIAAAARAPKAILCEKPMATNLGEAERMMIACSRNNVKLAIGHQRRFLPSWIKAKELIVEGAIGKPLRLFTTTMNGMLNATSHGLDCVRYVQGDPLPVWVMGQVERKTDRYERSIRCEDCLMGLVTFDNGAQALFQSDLFPDTPWKLGDIYGTDGMINVDDSSIRYFNVQTNGWKEIEVPQGVDPCVGQAQEIVEWIEGKVVHRGQAENSWWVMQIMMAVYESARCHEVVRLPFATRLNPLDLMVESGHLPVQRPGAYDILSFKVRGEAMEIPRCREEVI